MTRYTSKKPRPIPLDYCKENLVVDPESPSGLRWAFHSGNRPADLMAGSQSHPDDYYRVLADGHLFLAHRIVWALTYGPAPDGLVINHKDQDRSNNRVDNLELSTSVENNRHMGKRGGAGWYPVGISQDKRGTVSARIIAEPKGPTVHICPTFREHNDPTSERLNDMCAKALEAFIERDGPDSPTVASFYSQLPIEAILGPAEGYP